MEEAMSNSEAKKRLDHYLHSIINSNPRLKFFSEEKLLMIAERALHLPGDWRVQFERLLMEAEI
jgi:hypothetical protein